MKSIRWGIRVDSVVMEVDYFCKSYGAKLQAKRRAGLVGGI